MSVPGNLYLLPVPISDSEPLHHIPSFNLHLVRALKHFIAEDAKTARRSLKWFGYQNLQEAEIELLNEHTKNATVSELLKPLLAGSDVALMSDAGLPGIADPGAEVVRLAHLKGIRVIPLSGPSSIVLSIMSSGFNGQNFAFVGYLPVEKPLKIKRLKELEQFALKHRQAQFFIETPYRNEQMFETIIECLSGSTLLFMGKNITAGNEMLVSRTISQWKAAPKPALHKVPVVFGIYGHFE